MAISTYDTGIHCNHIEEFLGKRNAIKIIGFSGSGKSTLAEILSNEFNEKEQVVLHQNAAAWVSSLPNTNLFTDAANIDSELSEAIVYLEKFTKPYWIIDDAEIMLAFASEQILKSIAVKIQRGSFTIIFIRNRFVAEHSGWFHNRESLIDTNMPELLLRPLGLSLAVEVAQRFYQGYFMREKANWLAKVSGGIPGLMSELLPFASGIPDKNTDEIVKRLAIAKCKHLRLSEYPRTLIITALTYRILPPPLLLSDDIRIELAALQIIGMVHIDYLSEEDPFCGTFWRFAINSPISSTAIPDQITDAALDLSIFLEDQGLTSIMLASLDMENKDSMNLATAFANSIYCTADKELNKLVKPLRQVLSEQIGTMQLQELLKVLGISFQTDSKGPWLAELLLKHFSK